jgi:hypothetical protein
MFFLINSWVLKGRDGAGMGLSVGFIFPSSDYLDDPFKGDPHTHFQILPLSKPPLAAMWTSHFDLRGIKKRFSYYHIPECDVYLYSVYTLDFDEQVSIVNNLRRGYPQAKHIAGGPHAGLFQEECSKIFDSLIIGEGETTIIQSLDEYREKECGF